MLVMLPAALRGEVVWRAAGSTLCAVPLLRCLPLEVRPVTGQQCPQFGLQRDSKLCFQSDFRAPDTGPSLGLSLGVIGRFPSCTDFPLALAGLQWLATRAGLVKLLAGHDLFVQGAASDGCLYVLQAGMLAAACRSRSHMLHMRRTRQFVMTPCQGSMGLCGGLQAQECRCSQQRRLSPLDSVFVGEVAVLRGWRRVATVNSPAVIGQAALLPILLPQEEEGEEQEGLATDWRQLTTGALGCGTAVLSGLMHCGALAPVLNNAMGRLAWQNSAWAAQQLQLLLPTQLACWCCTVQTLRPHLLVLHFLPHPGRENHALTYIHRCPRCAAAAVRAVTNCILWSISVDDLAMLLEDLPGSPQQLCRAYLQVIARLLVRPVTHCLGIRTHCFPRYAALCCVLQLSAPRWLPQAVCSRPTPSSWVPWQSRQP